MAIRNIGQFGDRAVQTVGKPPAKPLQAGRSGTAMGIKAENVPPKPAFAAGGECCHHEAHFYRHIHVPLPHA
jgi:hypothetical protein